MIRKSLRLVNRQGLHMRAANTFANMAGRFPAQVRVSLGEVVVNGKSIMGLILLAAPCGAEIMVEIEGENEEAAFREISALVRSGFGEDTDGLTHSADGSERR